MIEPTGETLLKNISPETFHDHLDCCERCKNNPHELCPTGAQLLLVAATGLSRRGLRCEEASVLSKETYIPCEAPAVSMVDNGDRRYYAMCLECREHNVRNRRARVVRDLTPEEMGK